jgi:hypothetical protein
VAFTQESGPGKVLGAALKKVAINLALRNSRSNEFKTCLVRNVYISGYGVPVFRLELQFFSGGPLIFELNGLAASDGSLENVRRKCRNHSRNVSAIGYESDCH